MVLRLGAVQRVAEPGFNTRMPFVDSVVTVSTRTEKRTYENLQSYSRDVQEASIQVSVNYRIDPLRAAEVYAQYGQTYAERVIDPVVPQRLKEVFGQYQATTVVSDRTKLGQEVQKAISDSVPKDFIVESVQIENIDFSDAYEQAIEAAAQAESRGPQGSETRLDREKFEARRASCRRRQLPSRGASGHKPKRILCAFRLMPIAYATKLRGDAEASAIAARSNALG